MEKFIGFFEDGFSTTTWNIDIDAARFRLKDYERLHGDLVDVRPYAAYERAQRRAEQKGEAA